MDPISEIMTPQPLKVTAQTPIESCRSIMQLRKRRHLPVVDDTGKFIGLLTDHAVHLADDTTMAEDSVVPVPTAVESTPIPEALRRLDDTPMDALIVLDRQQHPVGIVTEHDAVRVAPALLEGTVIEVRRSDRPLVTVDTSETLRNAFYLLVENGIRHLPVLDGGAVRAVVSMRDLLRAGVTHDRDGSIQQLLMRDQPILSVTEGVRAVTAAAEMARAKVGCLLLTDPAGQTVGIVTRSDVISWVVATTQS